MKSKRKKPWLAWILGVAFCLMVPTVLVGKSAFQDLAAKIGSNKSFVNSVIRDYYAGKDITYAAGTDMQPEVKSVLADASKQLGKCLAFSTADTVPSFSDAMHRGYELTYNFPVQFDKGFKTFIVRVRNDDSGQKIISISSIDGRTLKNSIKRNIKEQLHLSSDKSSPQ